MPLETGQVMKAGREVVGRAGLFLTKKRYGILCLDIEGYQPEGGKLKAMGLEIKRSRYSRVYTRLFRRAFG